MGRVLPHYAYLGRTPPRLGNSNEGVDEVGLPDYRVAWLLTTLYRQGAAIPPVSGIENRISGECFETIVAQITKKDLPRLAKTGCSTGNR